MTANLSSLLPASLTGAAPAPLTPSAGVGVTIDPNAAMNAELARLRAAAPAPAPAPALPPGVDPNFAAAISKVESFGKGQPMYVGTAAAMYAALKGFPHNGVGYAGSGDFAGLRMETPEMVVSLANSYAAAMAQPPAAAPLPPPPAPAPVYDARSPVPPETPPSNPALAAAPVPGFTPPPGNPAAEALATMAAPAEAKKRGPGRPKKADAASAAPPTAELVESPPLQQVGGVLDLYIDCVPSGVPVQSFASVVEGLHTAIRQAFNAPDVRASADDQGPLGYQKWRGVLAAFARDAAANGKIPPGSYFIDSRDELAALVGNALDGYVVARGVR